jgi:transcriptional regulator with XRE-family HTH domain
MALNNFQQALKELGPTDRERAERLGVTIRTITRYKREEILPNTERLLTIPTMLRALAADAEQAEAVPAT